MPETVQRICYLEEASQAGVVRPGWATRELAAMGKPTKWTRWLGDRSSGKRIVYKQRCHLHWNDLELVSFLPGGGMLGYWCRCQLFVHVTESDQLLDELGTQEPDGPWSVSLDALAAWFREPIAEALETLGAKGDLCSEAYWPTVAEQVPRRLRCPRGVILDQPGEHQTSAFVLYKILTFEQYHKKLELQAWFLERLRQLGYDRQLVRVQLAAERGGDKLAERVLNELGEDDLATLITPEERRQSAAKRLSSYIELAGSAADSELGSGVTLGRYELLTPLGQGGQGQVWKAWETTGKRFVVLKLVPRELHNATDEMDRLQATFHIIQRLHHSHVCPVLLLDRDHRFGWYQVMQYIDGQTLSTYRATYTARYGSFPLEQVVKVLRPVAEALDYAHRQKVIHRDIKPANIMVSGEADDVQLVDFGLAAAIRTSMSTVSGQRMETSGTRPYMAPEQWRGEEQDARTDQYALAVVAYELLAGRLPFETPDFEVLRICALNDPPSPIEDQPESVNRALMTGLAKRREERFGSCVELIDAIGCDVQVAVNEIRALRPNFCRGTRITRQQNARKVGELAPLIDLDSILSFCTAKKRGERVAGFIVLRARLTAGISSRNTDRVIAVLKRGIQDRYVRIRYRAVTAVLAAPEVATQCRDVLATRRTKETNKTIRRLIEKHLEASGTTNFRRGMRRQTDGTTLDKCLDELQQLQSTELTETLDKLERLQKKRGKN